MIFLQKLYHQYDFDYCSSIEELHILSSGLAVLSFTSTASCLHLCSCQREFVQTYTYFSLPIIGLKLEAIRIWIAFRIQRIVSVYFSPEKPGWSI